MDIYRVSDGAFEQLDIGLHDFSSQVSCSVSFVINVDKWADPGLNLHTYT